MRAYSIGISTARRLLISSKVQYYWLLTIRITIDFIFSENNFLSAYSDMFIIFFAFISRA